ncbi:MAG TPA: hypothetical protein VGU20_16815, partial [Stellaceae bacterium]|nr:hypothetical protein [Stellaceae bacterium]
REIGDAIKAHDAKRAKDDDDARRATDAKLDKMLECLDGLSKRMDAVEARYADDDDDDDDDDEGAAPGEDGKPKRAANATGSAADARADAVAADSRPRARTDEERNALAAAQVKADEVSIAWGERAPPPLTGELLREYRIRMLRDHKRHSKDYADVDFATIPDGKAFDVAEARVYADSVAASANPPGSPNAPLIPRRREDDTGRMITTFHGSGTFIRRMTRPARRVVGFNNGAQPKPA